MTPACMHANFESDNGHSLGMIGSALATCHEQQKRHDVFESVNCFKCNCACIVFARGARKEVKPDEIASTNK